MSHVATDEMFIEHFLLNDIFAPKVIVTKDVILITYSTEDSKQYTYMYERKGKRNIDFKITYNANSDTFVLDHIIVN